MRELYLIWMVRYRILLFPLPTAPTERWKNLGCRALRQTGINILLEMEQRS